MKKLTPEEFAAMSCDQLRAWVEEHCVKRSDKGRPAIGEKAMTSTERSRRHRERKRGT